MKDHVNVIVVGGGAAGLAAAVAAEEAGFVCRLIEAQGRLGGRVRTMRLQSGGVVDVGAQMLNGDMTGVLELARGAGGHLSPIPQAGVGLGVLDDGAKPLSEFVALDDIEALLADEVVSWRSPREAWDAARSRLNWLMTPWEDAAEAGRGLRFLLKRSRAPSGSLAAALQALLLDPEDHAIAASVLSELFSGPPETISAEAVKAMWARYGSEREDLEFQLAGGMTTVIDQLVSALRHTPILHTPIRGIRILADRVEVSADDSSWTADHVIVAAPPPVARHIAFDMPGQETLATLLGSFTAGDMIKTVLVFETAFWRWAGLSGWATFTNPAGLVVVDGSLDTGASPRLVAFQGGPLARDWAALPQSLREERLLHHLSRAFGKAALSPSEILEAVWVDDRWSGGGYNATIRLGGERDAVARLAAWDGPVRFAGAELDDRFWGHVEGALRSGRKAIARITDEATPTAA